MRFGYQTSPLVFFIAAFVSASDTAGEAPLAGAEVAAFDLTGASALLGKSVIIEVAGRGLAAGTLSEVHADAVTIILLSGVQMVVPSSQIVSLTLALDSQPAAAPAVPEPQGKTRNAPAPPNKSVTDKLLGRAVRVSVASGQTVEGVLRTSAPESITVLTADGATTIERRTIVHVSEIEVLASPSPGIQASENAPPTEQPPDEGTAGERAARETDHHAMALVWYSAAGIAGGLSVATCTSWALISLDQLQHQGESDAAKAAPLVVTATVGLAAASLGMGVIGLAVGPAPEAPSASMAY